MRITSMDIDNKEFKKGFRGYEIDEVNDFLNQVADDYEELYKENSMLKEKVSMYEEKVEHYKKIEETIQNTLVLAQGASEQAKHSAQKEADIIIKTANDSAQRILDKAHNDVLKINDDYERIKQEFEKFRSIYRNFMNSQVEMFERLEKDFERGYNIGQGIKEGLNELKLEAKKAEIKEVEPSIMEENVVAEKESEFNTQIIDKEEIKALQEKNDKQTKSHKKEEKVNVEGSLNDFIKRNNIDLSKIKNSSDEIETLIEK